MFTGSTLLLSFFVLFAQCYGAIDSPQSPLNTGNIAWSARGEEQGRGRKLHGRFLQVTDIHPDPFYKPNSAKDAVGACHRGHGSAGYYGAEKSECDAPFSLVNATFQWIEENLKDSIDFIIWTGDSARHDNDEEYPRNDEQVLGSNQMLVNKFQEVFGRNDSDKPGNGVFELPIIPTFGNNDILPHNIFLKGPNVWTKRYAQVWRDIIPEEQRHAFDRGGWFSVEVIPNKLAVFSLNTLYFFDSNSAVDGCASPEEPGYEQMEWLRIQLGFLRLRGMKAILTGHVPPARSRAKSLWDESCWQKYAIWMQQYRDIVVGSIYGHMNIEHFILQDFRDIDYDIAAGLQLKKSHGSVKIKASRGLDDVRVQLNVPNYINSLRRIWAKLPSFSSRVASETLILNHKSSQEEYSTERSDLFDEVGGQFAERFSVAVVAASLVPNYFPTFRIYEYNITGLEDLRIDSMHSGSNGRSRSEHGSQMHPISSSSESTSMGLQILVPGLKKPHFTVPEPPSKKSPPGPAYSPQTLSWLGYTQYYANLTRVYEGSQGSGRTHLNSATQTAVVCIRPDCVQQATGEQDQWPQSLSFEVEYDTRNKGDLYLFQQGLTVKGWVSLAATVGEWNPNMEDLLFDNTTDNEGGDDDGKDELVKTLFNTGNPSAYELDQRTAALNPDDGTIDLHILEQGQTEATSVAKTIYGKNKKHKKNKKPKIPGKKRRKEITDTWYTFASRSVVGTMSRDELRDYFN